MYLKSHSLIALLIVAGLTPGSLSLHGQTASSASPQAAPAVTAPAGAAPAQPATTGTLHGHVLDATGALIPGAQVTVTTTKGGAAGTATANASGVYSLHGLAAGSYILEVNFNGFAPFVSSPIELTAGQSKNVDVKMAVEAAEQQVVVTDEGGPSVSTDAGSNASSMVLKGSDLDALSDDPDELSNELQALAGPSAGPNGGQIYIDGFTGGQLPPKSAIREIRINQNPFSAEFDRIGYGRIEILTKPGTDTLFGRAFAQGNDDNFNTKNPFTAELPSYYSYQYNGTVSGPMSKWSSFFFSVEDRETQTDNVYAIPGAPIYNSAGNTWSVGAGTLAGSLFNPANHLEVSPRVDLQLGEKNTLTLRYQFYRNISTNALGGSTAFPSLAASSSAIEHTFQLDDTQVITDRIVNETRFEYRRSDETATPLSTYPTFGVLASTAPGYSVPGEFSGGGSGTLPSSSHRDHFELQNFTTMTIGPQAIKFGTWLRDNREASSNVGNIYGSFIFPSVAAFVDTWNGIQSGETIAQIKAACPVTQAGGCLPIKLNYTTGPYAFAGNVFDGALFYQDDWKVNKFLTLSGGLRWETQNHVADHSDWAPRVAFAYALDGHKKGTTSKTVLRGGFGFFYDRFLIANLMNLETLNGTAHSQVQTVISNPTCFNSTSLNDISGGVSSCGSGAAATPVIYAVSSGYRSPYMEQTGISLERQLSKVSTLTFTYMHSSGFHQMVVRNANAYLPGTFQYGSNTLTGTRPDSSAGIVDQYYPEAVFNENQLTVNANARFSQNFGLFGFYTASWANTDGGGGSNPSNSYNLHQDYGRAAFVRRNWMLLVGNYTWKWGITFNPFLIAQSGRPFNIHSPYDLTGDNFFNDRPSFSTSASPIAGDVVQTGFGALNVVPQDGENIIPINIGNGPAAVAVNLRIGRSFGVGPKVQSPNGPMPGGGGPGGGPGGGGGHGGGHGGGPGGGPGGPFGGPFGGGGMRRMGGMDNTGRKYSLNFNVQALNLFNNIDLGTPHGGILPTADCTNPSNPGTCTYGPGPEFGKSTSLAGGIFSTPSAARRIYVQMSFQF